VNKPQRPLHYLRPLLQTDFVILVKNTRQLLTSVVVPLGILFVASQKSPSKQASGVIVVVAMTLGLMSLALIGYAPGVARDRERGVFQRLRVTPAPTWTIMISRLSIQVLVGLGLAIAVLIVGACLHLISLSAGECLYVLLVAVLESAVFLSMGQAVVGLVKSAATVNSLGAVLYVLMAFSGLYGFAGRLGGALQTFANWTPAGAVIVVFEGVLHQVAWSGGTTLSLLACFGYVTVGLFVGIKWFRWEVL